MGKNPQILQKILRTKFQNTKRYDHILIFCPFLVFRYFTSILDFYFDLEEGQNIKISSKYQNPDDHQNIKITALSTPNFARKASFCSVFQDLQENHTENWQKLQILQKILRTKFQNTKIS